MNRIERINDMLQTSPSDSFLQHALALEFVKLGDEQEAKRLLQKLLMENENYVGSYYQLAKLHERANEIDDAIKVYEKGMAKAKAAGEQHAYNELRSAYEEVIN